MKVIRHGSFHNLAIPELAIGTWIAGVKVLFHRNGAAHTHALRIAQSKQKGPHNGVLLFFSKGGFYLLLTIGFPSSALCAFRI